MDVTNIAKRIFRGGLVIGTLEFWAAIKASKISDQIWSIPV